MSTQYEKLSKVTTIVADTGDVESIKKYVPTDATTNPSLLLKSAEKKEYVHLLDDAIARAKEASADPAAQLSAAMDLLAVNFGCEILKIVPGVVSTEVDARLSYDTQATIAKAREIIALYEQAGFGKDRVLIKIASTWEGIEAARQLEQEGIHVNMTLLFSFCQAVACADAKATLISPFVGRIRDWYLKNQGLTEYKSASEDPGVHSVTRIFNYYKKFGHKTIVMGASFRNIGEILHLAGCDKLTIAPKFLDVLQANTTDEVPAFLTAESGQQSEDVETHFTESTFRWALCKDAMATEKLSEGIRNFAKDIETLEGQIRAKLSA